MAAEFDFLRHGTFNQSGVFWYDLVEWSEIDKNQLVFRKHNIYVPENMYYEIIT